MASRLCPFCMKTAEDNICPHCGKNVNYEGSPTHLPAGFVVRGRHPYVLGAALGQGGFGITYIALDMVTGNRVAIKEYFPTFCASRNDGTILAYPNQEETYLKGRNRFLDEAKVLKSLSDLESIVDVLDYFEFNNTAYLVMEFLEGSSLKEYTAKHGRFPAQQFLDQIHPLMENIERMHQRGVIHRDIAPDNIILTPDGQMKLIDFGAARSVIGDTPMTAIVKKGFAPVEQYQSRGSTTSTDVYALAATIYYCITGKVPMDSAERQCDSAPLQPPSVLGADIFPHQEAALMQALNIQQKERFQSVQDFLNAVNTPESSRYEFLKEQQKKAKKPSAAVTDKEKNLAACRQMKERYRKAIVAAGCVATVLVASVFYRNIIGGRTPDAEEHSHEWIDATCMMPQMCVTCGETVGVAAGHQWRDATYEEPKTCKVCGIISGKAKENPDIRPNIKDGDRIRLGTYEQDGNIGNGNEHIEWLVLDVQDNQALLLSRYALDCQPFNNEYVSVIWEDCSLRKWLNSHFLKTAFTDEENAAVLETVLDNGWSEGNPEWKGIEGKNTKDRVFLLSFEEAEKYLETKERVCKPTTHAVNMGADIRMMKDGITEAGWWWLRSPGEKAHHAAFINYDGKCYSNAVGNEYLSVRPALWVDLKSLGILGIGAVEPEKVSFAAVTDAMREKLPVVTYAMSDTQNVYSYSDASLTKRTAEYYFNAYNDEIVIMDVSKDGCALYVRYPSTISGTGYRDRWFAAKDILGSIDPDVYTYNAVTKTHTYSIKYNMRAMYGKIFAGQGCMNLGTHIIGNRVVIYPLTSTITILDVDVSEQMALAST